MRRWYLVPAALAGFPVGNLAEQAFGHEAGKTLAEHLALQSGAALHVIEPPHAVEGLAQDEERRPFSDDPHGRADRAVGRVVLQNPGPPHERMLNLVDRLSNTGPS